MIVIAYLLAVGFILGYIKLLGWNRMFELMYDDLFYAIFSIFLLTVSMTCMWIIFLRLLL